MLGYKPDMFRPLVSSAFSRDTPVYAHLNPPGWAEIRTRNRMLPGVHSHERENRRRRAQAARRAATS